MVIGIGKVDEEGRDLKVGGKLKGRDRRRERGKLPGKGMGRGLWKGGSVKCVKKRGVREAGNGRGFEKGEWGTTCHRSGKFR